MTLQRDGDDFEQAGLAQLSADLRAFVEEQVELRAQCAGPELPSAYWADFVAHFAYVFSLPVSELRRIRYHAYHLTSDIYQRYYFASPDYQELLLRGQAYFAERLGGFWLDEGELGIGVDGEHGRVSHDLLRYMGVLVDLHQSGCLTRDSAARVLELGGGYGGLARAVRRFAEASTYVICDLEETLFFSGVHLCNSFGPDSIRLLRSGEDIEALRAGQFGMTGQVHFELLSDTSWDLVINQQSMQEMTEAQVLRYLDFIAARSRRFYSCNLKDHGELAKQKGIVSDLDAIFEERFGTPIWVSSPPELHEQFGDNVLERKVYSCR
jgi:putative sugar O-methyltransferase